MNISVESFNISNSFKSLNLPTEIQNINILVTPVKFMNSQIIFGRTQTNESLVLINCEEDLSRLRANPFQVTETVSLSARTLVDPVTDKFNEYLELRFQEGMDSFLLEAFLQELLSRISSTPDISLLTEIPLLLDKWRKMLSLSHSPKLSLNEIVGLAGEIFLLKHLLVLYGAEALKSWVGPEGNRHDFEFATTSIEVKATLQRRKEEITIHGFEQLVTYPGKALYILLAKCEIEPFGKSLWQAVQDIFDISEIDKNEFLEKLSETGYRHESSGIYQELKLTFVEFNLIPVDEKFPVLTKESLKPKESNGRIVTVQYVVNTAGLESSKSKSINGLEFGKLW